MWVAFGVTLLFLWACTGGYDRIPAKLRRRPLSAEVEGALKELTAITIRVQEQEAIVIVEVLDPLPQTLLWSVWHRLRALQVRYWRAFELILRRVDNCIGADRVHIEAIAA